MLASFCANVVLPYYFILWLNPFIKLDYKVLLLLVVETVAAAKPAFVDVQLRPTPGAGLRAEPREQEPVAPSPATPHVSKKVYIYFVPTLDI